jgi:geranylgeranyl pyrophosphate synthase
VTALAAIRQAPGLAAYLGELETRLDGEVRSHPGLVATAGAEALEAGGKRLRPLLVFLASPPGSQPPLAAGVAVELVHLATLVHDDVIDGAHLRRGRPSAWSVFGPGVARATGDYLFARAFAALAETGDPAAISTLARAALALARGEALQCSHLHDASTPVEAYLERCALKTGALFEAACVLGGGGGGGGRFGLALGIAFQIVDDILDCSGETIETGKVAGTDLREGTPTLPLLLAAREDEVVRRALEGGSLDGALVRVARTGALEQSRAVALDYARSASAQLDGHPRREELDALTLAVVNRSR